MSSKFKDRDLQLLVLLAHLFICVLYYLTLYHDLQIDFPSNKLYAGRWKYLTFLNLVSHIIYFSLALLVDFVNLFNLGKLESRLIKIRDTFFAVLAFPVGVFVCVSFWGIYLKNRELIFPKWLDAFMSPLLNHALHTMVAISMLVEVAMVKHEYPSRKHGLMAVWTITLLYIIWVHWVAYYGGFWVYPILRTLGPYSRSLFLGLSAIVSGIMYLYGFWLTKLIWAPESSPSEAKSADFDGSKSKPVVMETPNIKGQSKENVVVKEKNNPKPKKSSKKKN